MSGNHPNKSMIKIGKNTETSPGDLRLPDTEIPVINHRLMLV